MITLAQAWCTTTPDAKLALAVPTAVTGKDAILFNGAKVYGPRLYPFLVTNWKFVWPTDGKLSQIFAIMLNFLQTQRESVLGLEYLAILGLSSLYLYLRK